MHVITPWLRAAAPLAAQYETAKQSSGLSGKRRAAVGVPDSGEVICFILRGTYPRQPKLAYTGLTSSF
jgi:hypothetical protein